MKCSVLKTFTLMLILVMPILSNYQESQQITQKEIDKMIDEAWKLKDKTKNAEAINRLGVALDLSRKINYKKGIGYSSYYLSCLILHSQIKQSADLCYEALNIANEIKDKYLEGYSYNMLGKANYYLGNKNNALDAHLKAIKIFRETNNTYFEIDSVMCILEINAHFWGGPHSLDNGRA